MAEGGRARSRSTASVDVPSGELAPILRAILQHNDQIVEQNQAILQLLNYHVQTLPADNKTTAVSKSSKDILRSSSQRTAVGSNRAEIVSLAGSHINDIPSIPARFVELGDPNGVLPMWDAILRDGSHQSPEFITEYHRWKRPWTIHEAFLGRQEWTSRSYEWAFPQLVSLLRSENAAKKCHAQVVVNDFAGRDFSPVVSAYSEARPRVGLFRGARVPAKSSDGLRRGVRGVNAEDPFACNLLWHMLDGCACAAGSPRDSPSNVDDRSQHYCMRGVNIMDISPRVLTCLLASTPRVDLSYMAAFVQRHLASSNWGKATPLRYGEHMSSYTLEYHFSCYYVTPNLFDASAVKPDLRRQRKSARFGIGQAVRSKYIHEENLSFLLIGHFKDVSTCVQLAESYFKYDPYRVQQAEAADSSTFRPLQPDEPPAALFLSWISVALHHVLWRWQGAIDAVQAEIKTSRHIVFMDDRNDLMADDPSFSLSKTYFWALQVYKLFDDTISETIAAWEKFSDQSLPQLQDPRISDNEWRRNVRDIHDAVDELRKKIEKIRTMADEVRELRKSLISASALFDSRTSVRQGENIRLLTYITLLFLPLSFATSIFGMQFMGATNGYIYAFASVLPAVTVLTALFVFNMENIIALWERSEDAVGSWLRTAMSRNNRDVWHDRAIALEQDLAASRAPVRKAKRETTAWTYMGFIIEAALVELPVSELASAASFARKLLGGTSQQTDQTAHIRGADDETRSVDPTVLDKINESLAKARERERWERRKKIGTVLLTLEDMWQSTPNALRAAFAFIVNVARALLLPVWVALVLTEYIILTGYHFLSGSSEGHSPEGSKIPKDVGGFSNTPGMRAFYSLGLQTVFPTKPGPTSTEPNKRESQARRQLSRAATRLTLLSEKSANAESQVDLVSPLPRSAPQIRLSPMLPSSPKEDRADTFRSHWSFGNKDPSRHTMDFIEDMSRTSTPVTLPSMPMPQSPPPSTTQFMGNAPTKQNSLGPPSQLPPSPPAHHTGPRYPALEIPRSPTVETDVSSRPDTATTDGLPIPELTARVQSMQRMSARTIRSQTENIPGMSEGNGFRQHGMRDNGGMEQRARPSVQDGDSAPRSKVVEPEPLSRPPTPPSKDGTGRSKRGNPDTP